MNSEDLDLYAAVRFCLSVRDFIVSVTSMNLELYKPFMSVSY